MKNRLSRWGKSSYETDESITNQKSFLSSVVQIVDDNSDAEIIVVSSKMKVGPDLISKIPSAKLLVTTTSGHEHLALSALHLSGIRTVRMPMLRRDAVVETTLALLLSGTRCLSEFHSAARENKWVRAELPQIMPLSIRGLRIGVVGCGVIGKRILEVLQCLGAKVIAFDPKGVPDGTARVGSILELAQQVDAITLHCDLNPSSHHIISKKVVDSLPKGAILINTARGGLVDEVVVLEALRNQHLAYVGLDVFENEPCSYLELVRSINGLHLLPHAAGFHQSLLVDMTKGLFTICDSFSMGDTIFHEMFSPS